MATPRLLGEVIARGSRSVVHAHSHGIVVEVPKPATPAGCILAETKHAQGVRAVGAPGVEEVDDILDEAILVAAITCERAGADPPRLDELGQTLRAGA